MTAMAVYMFTWAFKIIILNLVFLVWHVKSRKVGFSCIAAELQLRALPVLQVLSRYGLLLELIIHCCICCMLSKVHTMKHT